MGLEGGPGGRGAGGAGDADAVVGAEFYAAEEALGEGLAGGAFGAVGGGPFGDVVGDAELGPAGGVDGVRTCVRLGWISERLRVRAVVSGKGTKEGHRGCCGKRS